MDSAVIIMIGNTKVQYGSIFFLFPFVPDDSTSLKNLRQHIVIAALFSSLFSVFFVLGFCCSCFYSCFVLFLFLIYIIWLLIDDTFHTKSSNFCVVFIQFGYVLR